MVWFVQIFGVRLASRPTPSTGITFTSASYSGATVTGSNIHGEVVTAATFWAFQATAVKDDAALVHNESSGISTLKKPCRPLQGIGLSKSFDSFSSVRHAYLPAVQSPRS